MARLPYVTRQGSFNIALWLEFLALYAGIPVLVLVVRQTAVLVAALWVAAIIIRLVSRRHTDVADGGKPARSCVRAGAKAILVRFVLLAPLAALAVWQTMPQTFLALPRQHPALWLMVVLLYPVLSVWPQEVIYRRFLYRRYRPIFGAGRAYIVASAFAFGCAHLIFLNWIAPAMTLIGGALFAGSYRKYRSVALCCLEHALYGCLIFTLGLGQFFDSGAAWTH